MAMLLSWSRHQDDPQRPKDSRKQFFLATESFALSQTSCGEGRGRTALRDGRAKGENEVVNGTTIDNGERRAVIERLLGELRPKLHRYCARMTGSVIDGEDVVQDALVKAIEALSATQ